MTRRLLPLSAAFATLALVSCYPYPEQPPGHGPTGPGQTVTSQEQQKIDEQRERLKKAEEEAKRKELAETTGSTTSTTSSPANSQNTTTEKKKDYPFATAVPGKDGFVFSPYNQKVIDVREIQSGTLVQDPTYPAAEKKYFRVP